MLMSPIHLDITTMYDLVNLYLAFLDTLPKGPVTLMGLSFGGWLAAERASRRASEQAGELASELAGSRSG